MPFTIYPYCNSRDPNSASTYLTTWPQSPLHLLHWQRLHIRSRQLGSNRLLHLLHRQLTHILPQPHAILLKALPDHGLRPRDDLPPTPSGQRIDLRPRRRMVAHLQDHPLLLLPQQRLNHLPRPDLVLRPAAGSPGWQTRPPPAQARPPPPRRWRRTAGPRRSRSVHTRPSRRRPPPCPG